MAKRETIIRIQLENQDAIRQLGQWEADLIGVRKETTALNAAIRKNNGATPEQIRRLGELRSQAKALSGNIRELSNDTSGLTAAGMRFRDKMAEASRAGLGAFGLQALGVAGIVTTLVSVFKNAVQITADFDKAQSRLAGILGTTKDGMSALTEQAMELGRTTAFTASQVSDAQTELAKLGFNQQEIRDSTAAVLDLAAAAGTDLPNAATVAASTIRGFNLDASEAGRVTDVMARSFTSTSLDITKFSTAMATVAPVANSAGVSLERTTALLGILTDRGIDASTAGTSLRNIFLELSNQGLTWEQAMAKINGATDKNAVALDLFGKRGATAATIIAGAAGEADRLTDSFEKSAGAARDLAEAQLDNLEGDKLKLTSAWEGFILAVDKGDGVISKTLRTMTQGLTNIITDLTEAEGAWETFNAIVGAGSGINAQEKALRNFEKAVKAAQEANELDNWSIERLEKEFERLTKQREAFVKVGKEETAQEFDLKLAVMSRFIEMRKQQKAAADGEGNVAAAVGTVGAKVAELKGELAELKKTRDALSVADKEGIAATDAEIAATQAAIDQLEGKRTAIQKLTADVQKLTAAQKFQLELEGSARESLGDRQGIGVLPTGEFADVQMPPEVIAEEEITTLIAEQLEERNRLRMEAGLRDIQGITDLNEEKKLLMAEYHSGQIQSEEEYAARTATIDFAMAEQKRAAVGDMGSAIGAMAGFFEQSSAEFKAFATAEALISTYLGVAKALSDPTIPSTFARIAASAKVLVTGLLAVKRIQGFAQGGRIREKDGGRVRQSDGPRYTRNPGDSVLISAKPGEVVMNEEQQRRANRAAGFNIFRAARVPGFAVGGPVGGGSPGGTDPANWIVRTGTNSGTTYTFQKGGGLTPRPGADALSATANAMRINAAPIYVRVTEINDVQGRVARIDQRATL